MKTTRRIAFVAVVSLALAACAGDGGEQSTTTGEPGTTQGAGETADVTIAALAFSGPSTVALGTTVTVTNEDAIQHTWTSDDGEFNSGSLSQGDTFEFTFSDAGEYPFHCGIHPEMTGSITVEG